MKRLVASTSVAAISALTCHAQDAAALIERADQGLNFFSALNAAEFNIIGSYDMEFDNSSGVSVDNTTLELGAFISKPIELFGGYHLLPRLQYTADFLRAEGAGPLFPLQDQDLQEINLSAYIYQFHQNTPWVSGAWIDGSIASDFSNVSGDDFFLDLAAAVGYQFNDQLLLGVGVALLDATHDPSVIPGPGFMWNPNEKTFVALYGPNFRAGYEVNECWRLGFEVRPNGGIWNLDTSLGSRNLDFTSFRIGLTSNHRITEKLWFAYGAGATAFNSLNITTTDGSELYQNQLDEMDAGYFGFVSLNLKAW